MFTQCYVTDMVMFYSWNEGDCDGLIEMPLSEAVALATNTCTYSSAFNVSEVMNNSYLMRNGTAMVVRVGISLILLA